MTQTFSFRDDESFNGGLARWASERFIDRLIDVTAIAGVEYGHRQDAALFRLGGMDALAEAVGVPVEALIRRATPPVGAGGAHLFFGIAIPRHDLEVQHRRYSPAALAIHPYDRAIWHVRTLPTCVETGQFLIDSCPSPECGVRQGWYHTPGIDRCDRCLEPLVLAESGTVPDEQRIPLDLAIGLVHPDHLKRSASLGQLPDRVAVLGPSGAYELLMRLLPVACPDLPRRHLLHTAAPAKLAEAMAGAWPLLATWPAGFIAHADKLIMAAPRRHIDGNSGATVRFLNLARSNSAPAPVAIAIGEVRAQLDLAENPSLAKRNETVKQVARVVGRGTAIVAGLRRHGAIPARFAINKGRPVALLDGAEIEAIEATLDDRMPLEKARLPLGVSVHGIEQLVSLGHLQELAHPFFRARYGAMQISAASVGNFLRAVEAAAGIADDRPRISLHSAFKAVGGRLKPWGPAFDALLSARVGFTLVPGDEPISKRMMLRPNACVVLAELTFSPLQFPQIAFETAMSKIDAMETLNLGASQVTQLLSPIKTKTGTHARTVPVDYVERLARDHITSTELAARRGVSMKRAYHDAISVGVPIKGRGGFCRERAETEFFPNNRSVRAPQ